MLKFTEKLKKDFIILDGGMGTQLQAAGLELGGIPEMLNLTNPDLITSIHARYVAAGADVVYTNTFGANRKKMAVTGETVETLITAAVRNAKRSGASYVALDLGPIGAMLEPIGDLDFEEAVDIFAQQVKAGVAAGVDLFAIETMTDLYETKAAVLAVKENSDLPFIVTMSFEERGRTFTGTDPVSFAVTMESLGAAAIGLNCSLGPAQLMPIVKQISAVSTIPLVFKPNAGLPDPITNEYDVLPEEFAEVIKESLPYGVKLVGGCCGSTPDYISQVKIAVENFKQEHKLQKASEYMVERHERESCLCSGSKTVFIDQPRVIGERINPTGKKRFQEAVKRGDINYVLEQALSQVDAGADILDVNVGVPGIDEKEAMIRVVKAIQSVTDVPLQIDSTNPEVIEAGLRVYNGKPTVNSVNGDEESLEAILPIARKYGANVLGLTLDHTGIQKTASARVGIASRIYNRARQEGFKTNEIFIDCLTMTASTEQEAVMATLEAMQRVRREMGLKTILGVSNISFGLPFREQVTATFLTMALCYGLSMPIINPNIEPNIGAVRAYRLLANHDKNSEEYISAYAGYMSVSQRLAEAEKGNAGDALKKSASSADAVIGGPTEEGKRLFGEDGELLYKALVRGLRDEGKSLTAKCIDMGEPVLLVNEVLIPALDYVGKQFEKGALFLPQLIQSASVMQAASDVIKTTLLKENKQQVSNGKVVLATVKGDIHDIGKNIVRILLENYGFEVIDLGKDVPPEAVVKAASAEDVKLVGLSALMTTTLGSMKETIQQLKEAGLTCKTVVGGAVMTPEYAVEIGADYYAKDALRSCRIAEEVYGVNK
ncbi:MAG: homocysteine S-methyltransferase family protein [Lachnospiraceae bacterium]|nr:homocysteine S-methyltransferase family protein [Lachnospiraceae bacterium]